MAAYAALVSLMHIIDNLENHPRPPISLHKDQVHLLTQKINSLQEFLEGYKPHLGYTAEADPLETHITDAAHAAEDVIKSHIVDQITNDVKKMSSDDVHLALEKVIEQMSLIEKEALEIKQTTVGVQNQLHKRSTPLDSSRSIVERSSMVGADQLLLEMKERLTADCLDLQIVPIVGMGGTGKTTLARNLYQDRLIQEHFHICAWTTISQEYSIQEILIEVLKQLNAGGSTNLSEGTIGEMLHKHLYGRKYMIVLDDMWSIKAWDGVKRFLPNNKNGSRIVITTRLSNLASKLPNSNSLEMKLLDEADSWDLLSKTVFGEKECPLEMLEIGKKIGKNCKGLPLSIVVVGGLLAKSEDTIEFWEYIEENLNSIVNSEDDERCLKILYMSYKQLPVYLKPCFLYMGVFAEDEVIRISRLVKLWVAEGFLKPVSGKRLEEIAKEYLNDLIGRNLILGHRLGSLEKIKECKIHDLLRDLCLREAQKERFLFHTPNHQGVVSDQRRIVVSSSTLNTNAAIDTSESRSLARSLKWHLDLGQQAPLNFRLLRTLEVCKGENLHPLGDESSYEFLENVCQLVNTRFLCFMVSIESILPDSIWLFWNLQTIIADKSGWASAPTEIWYMPHIRHIQLRHKLSLPSPPEGQDDIVLRNLQTLGTVKYLKFCELVVKKIPNIKTLVLDYSDLDGDLYCLSNLVYLDKLESLTCFASWVINGSLINFPQSLKRLCLDISYSHNWEDILDKVGALPLLQKLWLRGGITFNEGQWETSEGQFRSLKFLSISSCEGLQVWTTESSHFPCLERLVVNEVRGLEEIPLEFAEISTLKVINMTCCKDSAVESAKRVVDEQEDFYGEEAALHVQVTLSRENNRATLESLASPNFRFTNLHN